MWYNQRIKYWLVIKNKLHNRHESQKHVDKRRHFSCPIVYYIPFIKECSLFFYYCVVFHLYEVTNRQSSLLVLEIRTAIASGVERLTAKGHERTFWSMKMLLYFDSDVFYMGVYMYQNATIRICVFYYMYLSKFLND